MKNAIAKYLPGKYLENQKKTRLSPNSTFPCDSFRLECKIHMQEWTCCPLDWKMLVSDRRMMS